ncbi:MAG: hypothetical protein ACRDLL_09775 [Solirubrobacterales bacterium]
MRRLLPTGVTLLVALAAFVVTISGTALAYFTTTGAGQVSIEVSEISAPSITVATPAAGGTVALAWSAVSAPGPGAVTYAISRNGGAPAAACPSSSSPASVTACTDSGLEPGTYNYVVTAKWHSWTATSAVKQAKVTVGPLDHFVLAAASSTPSAAAADNLTITAADASGSTVTTYINSHNLTFSGAVASPSGTKPTVVDNAGTVVSFGTATAINFTSGVATVASSKNGVMKLYKSGATVIEVSDGSISTATLLEVTVAPLGASKLVLAAATSTPTAGVADNLTVTAQDAYGNTATTYTGSKSLTYTGASASPNGTVPTVSNSSGVDVAFGTATATTFSAGVASVSGTKNGATKLYKSGSTSVKVSDGTFSVTLTFTVSPAAASTFGLSAASTTPASGASDNLTITAFDPYGTTDTAYAGTHTLVFSGSSASLNGTPPTVIDSEGSPVEFGAGTAIGFTSGVAKVASAKNGVMKLYRAGAASIAVSEGTISTTTPVAVTVSAGAAAQWALTNISISAGVLGPTCLFTCTLTGIGNSGTVTARVAVTDGAGNTVSAVGKGHAAKVTTDGSGTIAGTPLAIPNTGAAESATSFTYTSKSAGDFTQTVTVAASAGTAYTPATLSASK